MVIAPYAVGTLYPKGCRRLRCWTMPNPDVAPKQGVYLFDENGDLLRVRRITADTSFWFERLSRDQWDTGKRYHRFLAAQAAV